MLINPSVHLSTYLTTHSINAGQCRRKIKGIDSSCLPEAYSRVRTRCIMMVCMKNPTRGSALGDTEKGALTLREWVREIPWLKWDDCWIEFLPSLPSFLLSWVMYINQVKERRVPAVGNDTELRRHIRELGIFEELQLPRCFFSVTAESWWTAASEIMTPLKHV